MKTVSRVSQPFDWNGCCNIARDAFRDGVRDWIQNSYVTGGLINGPDCALPSGTLRGDVTFDDRIKRAVLAVPGLPVESVADEFASGLRRAWDQWFKSYSAVWPGAFPAFAAFPGPIAPPMPPVGPRPLALGASPGMLELTSSKLYNNLAPRIQRQVARLSSTTANPSGVDTAVRSLADWVDRSFRNWHVVAYFRAERIHGSGPVPTFAPPYVPVGPVVGGTLRMSGGLGVLGGPQFGM